MGVEGALAGCAWDKPGLEVSGLAFDLGADGGVFGRPDAGVAFPVSELGPVARALRAGADGDAAGGFGPGDAQAGFLPAPPVGSGQVVPELAVFLLVRVDPFVDGLGVDPHRGIVVVHPARSLSHT